MFFRLDQMSIPGFYKQMIHDCLNINANERPRFKHLNEFLSSLEYTNAANNLLKAEEKNSKPIYGHDLRVDSSSSWASDSKTEKYTSRAFNYRNQKSKPVFRPNSITSSNMRRRSKRNRLVVSLSALILFLLVAIITILALFFTNRFGNTGNISSSLSTETISVNSTNSTNNISTDNSSSSISSRFQAPWSVGVHSFDLFSYSDDIQQIVLNELKKTNVTVIRIHIQQTFRGDYVQSDVEVGYLGNYDDNILYRIDKFMVKVQHSGMKLIIALHDR